MSMCFAVPIKATNSEETTMRGPSWMLIVALLMSCGDKDDTGPVQEADTDTDTDTDPSSLYTECSAHTDCSDGLLCAVECFTGDCGVPAKTLGNWRRWGITVSRAMSARLRRTPLILRARSVLGGVGLAFWLQDHHSAVAAQQLAFSGGHQRLGPVRVSEADDAVAPVLLQGGPNRGGAIVAVCGPVRAFV